jgi:hypothetical protein
MNKLIMFSATLAFISGVSLVIAQELPADTAPRDVKSLEDRIEQLEKAVDRSVENEKWYGRIKLNGLAEAETSYGRTEFNDPAVEDEEISDIDLATVELAVDAKIINHVDGHVMLKYEDDDFFVDEGFITLTGQMHSPCILLPDANTFPLVTLTAIS